MSDEASAARVLKIAHAAKALEQREREGPHPPDELFIRAAICEVAFLRYGLTNATAFMANTFYGKIDSESLTPASRKLLEMSL